MRETCLNQKELAARWKVSHRTLERWRWMSEGPSYLKIGGRVLYRIEDIEKFELAVLHATEREHQGGQADKAKAFFVFE